MGRSQSMRTVPKRSVINEFEICDLKFEKSWMDGLMCMKMRITGSQPVEEFGRFGNSFCLQRCRAGRTHK